MRAAIVSLVGILVGLGGAPISASTEPLREYFESVSSLQGTFKQVTRDEQGQVVKRSKGQFSLKRPDRFHWFYETPFKQRLVSNGKWLYSHDVELLQVTIRPIEEVLGVGPAVVLSGDFQDLQASFRIREGEDVVLELVRVDIPHQREQPGLVIHEQDRRVLLVQAFVGE